MSPKKAQKKKSETPLREYAELIVMALAVVLLFKAFIFEVSSIPSGSMQPTLMGHPEARVFDRLAVDKLSFHYRDPERWEVVVFRHPLERSRDMVKRICGMPGEQLKIENGDLWTRPDGESRWEILRRSAPVEEAMWRPLTAREGRAEWTSMSGHWRIAGGSLESDAPGRVRFRADRSSVFDDYTDGYPEKVRAVTRRVPPHAGQTPVGDLRLDARVRAGATMAELRVRMRDGDQNYAFVLPGPAAPAGAHPAIEIEGGGTARAESSAPLQAGREVKLRVQNLDDELRLVVDGEVLCRVDVAPVRHQLSHVEVETIGGGARLEDVAVFRDLHYLGDRAHSSRFVIPDGHYVVLGDNTQDSADSRDWRVATYRWSDEAGEVHELAGNFRPGDAHDSNPTPVRGTTDRHLQRFRDVYGETHFIPRDARLVGPEPAPLIPRELIRGRGFGVFWPLKPHRGIWRLGWVH
jgi:signal peptidase I